MKKICEVVAVFMLSACIGISQQAKFYTMSPITQSTLMFKNVKSVIGIDELKMPIYLDRPQMVVRSANGNEIKVSEYNRWSEPLNVAMQRAVAENMAVYLPKAVVKPSSFRSENFDYTVWIEVNQFDGSWDKSIVLNVWWTVFDKDGDKVLQERSVLERPLKDNYTDMVEQADELVAELSRIIAQKIAKIKK